MESLRNILRGMYASKVQFMNLHMCTSDKFTETERQWLGHAAQIGGILDKNSKNRRTNGQRSSSQSNF